MFLMDFPKISSGGVQLHFASLKKYSGTVHMFDFLLLTCA